MTNITIVNAGPEFNSRDMLKELKHDMDVRNPKFEFYSPALMDVLEARINNELQVSQQLAHTLALMPCACVREYPYHGKGVKMCVRCRALVLWETLTVGKSVIQEQFDKVIPK